MSFSHRRAAGRPSGSAAASVARLTSSEHERDAHLARRAALGMDRAGDPLCECAVLCEIAVSASESLASC
jgi:hypothetical protein